MLPIIIIFDDDQDTLELFARICQNIAIVRSSTDPWLFLEENNLSGVNLVIIDVHFGQKSSLNLIGDLKSRSGLAQVPVILHSGHDRIELMAAQSGADGFLKKPASIQAIRSCIQRHLESIAVPISRTL